MSVQYFYNSQNKLGDFSFTWQVFQDDLFKKQHAGINFAIEKQNMQSRIPLNVKKITFLFLNQLMGAILN